MIKLNKRAQESTQWSYVSISGVVIVIIAIVIILSFVVRVGGSTNSYLPAYVRDVGNIMEGVTSTDADISVIYTFTEPTSVDYKNFKLSLSQQKLIVPNRVYIPSDIEVVISDTINESTKLLISKKGTKLFLLPVGYVGEATQKIIRVVDVHEDCGDGKYDFSISTKNMPILKDFVRKYPPKEGTTKIEITQRAHSLQSEGMIIYYNPNKVEENLLCRFDTSMFKKLKISPIFVATDEVELLEENDLFITVTKFDFTQSEINKVFELIGGKQNS